MSKGRTTRAAFVAALAVFAIGAAGSARAQNVLYRRVDERGVVHFTNTPSDHRWAQVSMRKPMGPPVGKRNPAHFDGVIQRTARLHGVPPALVKAVIRAESNFDPSARSDKGAMGLMQLMPATAGDLGVVCAFDPRENILGGTRYLRHLYDLLGAWPRAVAAYNAGPARIESGRIPAETRRYVDQVIGQWRPEQLVLNPLE